ncbi:MAG: anthranilate phosphoribosyltransferase, partial [Bacteroidales bacterium]
FLHAPMFNPAMKNIAPIRRELSVKTFFNMLGPMVNPSSPKNQLIGVFNLELARIYNYIYQQSSVNYAIINSLDGYDEISLTGEIQIQTKDSVSILSPYDLGFKNVNPDEIQGGNSVKESANLFFKILNGEGTRPQNDIVIANAGAALKTIYNQYSYDRCFEIAKESLLEQKALASFKTLLNL